MLFKNFYNDHDNFRMNESNFISSDWTKLFDSDAKFRLFELTLDKLFEGLDLEKSIELQNFIKSNIPSLAPVILKYNDPYTNAFDFVKSQISYITTRIINIEKELAEGFENVLKATSTSFSQRSIAISQITSPTGYSSVIPKIDQAVKKFMKNTNMDLKSEALRQSFLSLYKLNISSIITDTLNSLEQSSKTQPLKALYTKVDLIKMEKIEADTVTSLPKFLVGSILKPSEYISSTDIYDRLAGFYEMVLNMYPFGQQLSLRFGENYSSIDITSGIVGPDAILSLNQFQPSVDISNFKPMATLLNEVSSILIDRVFLQNPDEDLRNIFTPSLQVMYMCLLSIVSLKLINLNLEVEALVIKTEEDLRKQAELKKQEEQLERPKKLLAIMNKLESLNFFQSGGLVYKVGSTRMNPEIVKLINNFFILYKVLDISKWNDTNYDAKTSNAVLEFQKRNKLFYLDGKIGNETKGMMKQQSLVILSERGITTTDLDPFSPLLYKI